MQRYDFFYIVLRFSYFFVFLQADIRYTLIVMRRISLFLFYVLLAMVATAQTARKFTVNITPDGEATLTAYLPELPLGRAVVDCPGGGYSHLSMDNEGHNWAAFFNEQGIAYFVLKYRMPKGDRTIPMDDGKAAIRMVRDSAEQWGVNPRDVGIMGFSAGGHLASTISTHTEWAERPDFSILFYPVISMNARETHRGSCENFLGKEGQQDEKLVKMFSNQNAVRRHLTPPAIILTTNDDRVVPPVTNAIAYYSAMRRAGNDCALYVYPTGGHGFGMNPRFKYHEQMLGDLREWLLAHKAPQADAVRVACIGNSITDGDGIDMADLQGYPAQLQRMLGSGYDVRNFGLSGRTMLQNGDRPYMKEQGWKDAQGFLKASKNNGAEQPDIVIIKLGTNDSKPNNWAHKDDFEQDIQTMIDALRPMVPVLNKKGKPTKKMQPAATPRIYLCTPIPTAEDRWGITDKVISEEVAPAIRRVAEKNGITVIDLHEAFDAKVDGMMQRDGIHPTDKGAHRMAEIIAGTLRK
jgi:acetyl esterase/lipase